MISTDDSNVLGITATRSTARRPSTISEAVCSIRCAVDSESHAWDLTTARGETSGFSVCVASTLALRQRAYLLAHRMYEGRGYVQASSGFGVNAQDANPQTLTLLVQDADHHDVATITLIFDSDAGLPCDEIYAEELNALRTQGRHIVEVTRLAIAESHQPSTLLLTRLFNFVYIFARRIHGFDDFVIEVNPRHVTYYRRLLQFELFGPVRPCPRVQGAPAVLLRLELAVLDREMRRVRRKGPAANERTLFPHFFTWLEEGAVAEFLAQYHKPMTEEEQAFFGLKLLEQK